MAIKVGEEKAETVYNFPVEIDEPERSSLLTLAKREISEEEMEELLLEWVMLKIIREKTEEFLNSLPEEDK